MINPSYYALLIQTGYCACTQYFTFSSLNEDETYRIRMFTIWIWTCSRFCWEYITLSVCIRTTVNKFCIYMVLRWIKMNFFYLGKNKFNIWGIIIFNHQSLYPTWKNILRDLKIKSLLHWYYDIVLMTFWDGGSKNN